MKPAAILSLALLLGSIVRQCPADDRKADPDEAVNVATYSEALFGKDGKWVENKDGRRLEDILIAHGIRAYAGITMDDGTEIAVRQSQADQARQVIAEAVMTKGLKGIYLNPEPNPMRQDELFLSPDQKLTISATPPGPHDENESTSHWAQLCDADGLTVRWIHFAYCQEMVFSWSPDSSHFLFGVIGTDRSMTLYDLDTNVRPIKEHDLNLAGIERQVAAQLPVRKEGNLAPHRQIDFDHVAWDSGTRCRLTFDYSLDRKAGEAALSLDLAAPSPQLQITKITSQPEP